VIGQSPLDGILLLSFEQKVLDQVFMQVGELHVGQALKVNSLPEFSHTKLIPL
jgi:rRNA biogenesis protein RRP5